jgi:hypothetical protein
VENILWLTREWVMKMLKNVKKTTTNFCGNFKYFSFLKIFIRKMEKTMYKIILN